MYYVLNWDKTVEEKVEGKKRALATPTLGLWKKKERKRGKKRAACPKHEGTAQAPPAP